MKTLRLLNGQWQGASIARWLPSFPASTSSRGYSLGSSILDLIVPSEGQVRGQVPIDMEWGQRVSSDGVLDKALIMKQLEATFAILDGEAPDRVLVLGGECAVSVAPFTWMAGRYEGDTAMIWIDAHPDITLPGDTYEGFHAMAAAACMGLGDADITAMLPATISTADTLYVGLRDWERDEVKRRHEALGMAYVAGDDIEGLEEWLRRNDKKHVLIHFDLDVIDPEDMVAAVGVVPGGPTLDEVIAVINKVTSLKSLAALTIAEPMPRIALRLRDAFSQLEVFK